MGSRSKQVRYELNYTVGGIGTIKNRDCLAREAQ